MRRSHQEKRRNDEGMSNYKPSAGGRAGGGRAGGGRAGVEGGLLRDKTVLFTPQSEGYPHYRIPALLLAGQVLLAFAEGRKQLRDHGWVDLALRRSTDFGRSWSPIKIVRSESNSTHHVTVGNPAAS